jgi:tryptophanyl-tRNA synthetase
VTELHTILSMVTPLGKLTDLPTFKEKARSSLTTSTTGWWATRY